jgi:hypothetical protein
MWLFGVLYLWLWRVWVDWLTQPTNPHPHGYGLNLLYLHGYRLTIRFNLGARDLGSLKLISLSS